MVKSTACQPQKEPIIIRKSTSPKPIASRGITTSLVVPSSSVTPSRLYSSIFPSGPRTLSFSIHSSAVTLFHSL